MAHNFRRHLAGGTPVNLPNFTTGSSGNTTFLSKAGSDSNSGDTPDTPLRTLAAAIAAGRMNIVVGTGSYRSNGPITFNTDQNRYLYADGNVVIDMQGADVYCGQGWLMEGIIMRNIGKMSVVLYGGGTARAQFFRSELNFIATPDINLLHSDTRRYGLFFTDCTIRNARMVETYNTYTELLRCIVLNSTFDTVRSVVGCDVAPDSKIRVNDPTLTEYANSNTALLAGIATRNNWRGLIAVGGSGMYGTLADQRANFPGLNADSIATDPRYNRPAQEDYTLKLQSPHLNLGIGPAHLRFANSYFIFTTASPGETCTTANTWIKNTISEDFRVNLMSISGFTVNVAGGLVIRPNSQGDFEGFLQTERVPVSDVPVELLRFGLIAGLNFDTDFPAVEPAGTNASASPELFNNNVPDYSDPGVVGSGSAGRNPNRLSQQMRWSETGTPDNAGASGWKFGNTWMDFEINSVLRYNQNTLVGNGSPDFNPGNSQGVFAKFVQMRIKTRNNYFSQ